VGSGLHRAGIISADFDQMTTTALIKKGAKKIDNLAQYISVAMEFALARAEKVKAAQLAAAKAAQEAAKTAAGGANRRPSLGRLSSGGSAFSGGGASTGGESAFTPGGNSAFSPLSAADEDEEEAEFAGVRGATSFQRQMFHGTSLELVLAKPATEGLKWGTKGLNAMNYDQLNGSLYYCMVHECKQVGDNILYNMVRVDHDSNLPPAVPFAWGPRELAGGFFALEQEQGGVPLKNSGGLDTSVVKNIEVLARAAAANIDHDWDASHDAVLKKLNTAAAGQTGTLTGLDGITSGSMLVSFHRWVVSGIKTFATVKKAMPALAERLERFLDEYNFQWKSSFSGLLVMRLLAFSWKQVSEDDLVAALIPSDPDATEEEVLQLEAGSAGRPLLLTTATKKAKARGGFTSVSVINDVWVHLDRLFTEGHGVPFSFGLIKPLEQFSRRLGTITDYDVEPQKKLWLALQRDIGHKYTTYVSRTLHSEAQIRCTKREGGFGVYSHDEMTVLTARIQSEWNTAVNKRMRRQLDSLNRGGGGGGGGDGGAGGGGGNGGGNGDGGGGGGSGDEKLSKGQKRKRARDRKEAELKRLRALEQSVGDDVGGGGAYGVARNNNQRPKDSTKHKTEGTLRPHWIPDDDDWAVVQQYGKDKSYKQAVGMWLKANSATLPSGSCFWKFHNRTCMNKQCPACHPRSGGGKS